jgi:CheY-like chemotaxis protein
MALRVLLADESSTIKKVMQLALQDFAVEVKAVPVGLDVLAVTKTFKPDIVFADVLLTKRNGYEVCADLKNDPETAATPVVLMWSGFMELDEVKAGECRADRRLEKPFDADTLRGIVKDLVQKTKTNPLSEYLTFPPMPEFEEAAAEPMPAPSSEALRAGTSPGTRLDEIYAIPEDNTGHELEIPQGEEFSEVPLTASAPKSDDGAEDSDWSHQDLSKFKIQIPKEELAEGDDFASKFVIPQEELSQARIEVSGQFEEISFDEPKTKTRSAIPAETVIAAAPTPEAEPASAAPAPTAAPKVREESVKTQSRVDIDSEMMEKILREQAREVIESICWKVLPDIAERVVREEIQKILRDNEK